MVVLHAFVALAAGFIVLAALSLALSALVTRMVPSWSNAKGLIECGPGYAFVNLGSAFLSAAAGGYGTAWVAAANPLVHVLALGLAVLALAALSTFKSRGKAPIWFQLAQVAISPLGVLAGGLVRLRVLGML
jgi:hypothetical protein